MPDPTNTPPSPWRQLAPAGKKSWAALGAIVALLVGITTAMNNLGIAPFSPGSSSSPSSSVTTSGGSAQTGAAAGSTPTTGSTASTDPKPRASHYRARWEIADLRSEITAYRDNAGAASNVRPIPIGSRVRVLCAARNLSGIGTINLFYRLASGPWAGLYAPANQFANGAPVGVATNADPVDTKVRGC